MQLSSWLTNEQVQELIDKYYGGGHQDNQWISEVKDYVELVRSKLLDRDELDKLSDEELIEILILIYKFSTRPTHQEEIPNNITLIRKAITYLSESNDNLKTKVDAFLKKDGTYRIKGLYISFWSIFFMAIDPLNNPNWNNKTEKALDALGIEYWRKDYSFGQQYQKIKEAQQQLIKLYPKADLFSIDHFMHFVTDKKEEGTKLLEQWKSKSGDKHILKWAELIKQWQKEHLPQERINSRKESELKARKLLENNIGSFDDEKIRLLFELIQTESFKGKQYRNRFGRAFVGNPIQLITKRIDPFNEWLEKLWKVTDSGVKDLIDQFIDQEPIPGAGSSWLTLILYLRTPSKYNIWLDPLVRGLKRLTDFRPGGKSGAAYIRYNNAANRIRKQYKLQPQEMDRILSLASKYDEEIDKKPISSKYTFQLLKSETFLKEDFLIKLEKLLSDKSQIVLYGPPGTGKTFVAKKFARYFVDQAGGGEIEVVQFHPSYAYEEFVEGIRPRTEDGQLSYEVETGIFRKLCEQAEMNQHSCYVLILDEINRGNLPRIFGELLYLLEYREATDSVTLPYSQEQFKIPSNLYIIGTMNTADRSIALVDHALRRRFHFIDLRPDTEILKAWLDKNGLADMAWAADLLAKLNQQLENDNIDWHLHIGHSHFMVRDGKLDEERVQLIWEYSIRPTLEEYFYKQKDRLDNYDYESLKRLVTGASEEK